MMAVRKKLSHFVLRKFLILLPFMWFCGVSVLLYASRGDMPSLELKKLNERKQYQIAHAHDGKLAMHVPDHDGVEYFYKPELAPVDGAKQDDYPSERKEVVNKHDVNQGRIDMGDVDFVNVDNDVQVPEKGVNKIEEKDVAQDNVDHADIDENNDEDDDRDDRDDHNDQHRDYDDEDDAEVRGNDEHDNNNGEKRELDQFKQNLDIVNQQIIDEDLKNLNKQYSDRNYVVQIDKSGSDEKSRLDLKDDEDEETVTWPNVPLVAGLGEGGKSVKLEPQTPAEEAEKKAGYAKHDFNQFLSDRISVRRNLSDYRIDECKKLVYPDNMPDTSVVIIFHNEAWTTLLRTVHSVLDRTPAHLLKEIILVDDYSDYDFLKRPLDEYTAQFVKVKVVHTDKREGLIRARLVGVEHATGDTVTFLDSHCECNIGWIEPLLARIAEDRSHVVTPVIDMVDRNTFGYTRAFTKLPTVGTFSWSMTFKWGALTKAEKEARKNHTNPARSPTMAGGLFTIHREYFHHIGLYDTGMEIWGGENVELSFRIWMCGGTLEVIPCSRVGHIFRTVNPNLIGTKGSPVTRNTMRLVEIWMDQYKYLYYENGGGRINDYGSITDRIGLKEKLQCKSFGWYLEHIVPEMFVPTKAIKMGGLQNQYQLVHQGHKCLDHHTMPNRTKVEQPIAKACNKHHKQRFYLTKLGELRLMSVCMDYSLKKDDLTLINCHGMEGNQKWIFTDDSQIKHSSDDKCLAMTTDGQHIVMQTCADRAEQKWTWVDIDLPKHTM